jgi:hypothetical protein
LSKLEAIVAHCPAVAASVSWVASSSEIIYRSPATSIDFDIVRQFVLDAEAINAFTESLTFEAKERRSGNNIVEAVAALSNTNGGVVLVGVKDKDAVGEDRIVGVPLAEHDSIVNQLQNLIPTAMPEVTAVRIPGKDRLILVLRVDADVVPHPVLVAGKVLYRVPGSSVPADRQRLLDLVARDASSGGQGNVAGRLAVPNYPWQPAQTSLWPREGETNWHQHTGELRVVGGLTLPNRIMDRPWLDTRAKEAAVEAFRLSPVEGSSAFTEPHSPWRTALGIEEARATAVRLAGSGTRTDAFPITLDGRAYLDLSGRSLSLLIALRWLRVDDRPSPLPLDVFYWVLLASLVSIYAICRDVARALDADEPNDIQPSEAWLTSDTRRVIDAVDISQFGRDSLGLPEGANFPSARPPTIELPDLDRLTRNWLTYWLLDIGTYDFEGWLAGLAIPDWIRFPTPDPLK